MPLMEEIKKKKKQIQNAIGGTIAQVPKVTVGEVAKTAGRIGKKMAMAGTLAGTGPGGANVIRKSIPLLKKLEDKKYEYAKPMSMMPVIRRRARR